MPPVIDLKRCDGCAICDINCPGDIIVMDEITELAVVKYPEECWHCGVCRLDCPTQAIKIVFPKKMLYV
jgi:NAD-dependent dihydropyrimidine dehydrogenase PreA subunit